MQRKITSSHLLTSLEENPITILTGFPHSGKTHVLDELTKALPKQNDNFFVYKIETQKWERCFRNAHFFVTCFLKEADTSIANSQTEKNLYIFFDNIHEIFDFVNFLQEAYEELSRLLPSKITLRFFATSALQYTIDPAHKNMVTITPFALYPYSWPECFFKTQNSSPMYFSLSEDFEALKDFDKKRSQEDDALFISYLQRGGFPELWKKQNSVDPKEVLQKSIASYLESVIAKHLVQQDMSTLIMLIEYLSEHTGELLNTKALSSHLNLPIAEVHACTMLLKKTFFFSFVNPFFSDLRYETTKRTKAYAVDQLFIDYPHQLQNGTYTQYWGGKFIENFVYTELKKMHQFGAINFYRTTTKQTISFIAHKNSLLIPFDIDTETVYPSPSPTLKKFLIKHAKKIPYAVILTKRTLKKTDNTFYIPIHLFSFITYDLL